MDLLYGVFTLMTDPCPLGWDGDQSSGIRVVWGPGLTVKGRGLQGENKNPLSCGSGEISAGMPISLCGMQFKFSLF